MFWKSKCIFILKKKIFVFEIVLIFSFVLHIFQSMNHTKHFHLKMNLTIEKILCFDETQNQKIVNKSNDLKKKSINYQDFCVCECLQQQRMMSLNVKELEFHLENDIEINFAWFAVQDSCTMTTQESFHSSDKNNNVIVVKVDEQVKRDWKRVKLFLKIHLKTAVLRYEKFTKKQIIQFLQKCIDDDEISSNDSLWIKVMRKFRSNTTIWKNWSLNAMKVNDFNLSMHKNWLDEQTYVQKIMLEKTFDLLFCVIFTTRVFHDHFIRQYNISDAENVFSFVAKFYRFNDKKNHHDKLKSSSYWIKSSSILHINQSSFCYEADFFVNLTVKIKLHLNDSRKKKSIVNLWLTIEMSFHMTIDEKKFDSFTLKSNQSNTEERHVQKNKSTMMCLKSSMRSLTC